MTPLILIDELCKELTQAIKNFRLENGRGDNTPPNVFAGYLPKKDVGEDDSDIFPYVIARLVEVEDKDDRSMAKVVILIGTHAEDDGFWRDCLNVGERIRQNLLAKRTIANRFRLELPLKLETPDGDSHPYPEAICWLNTIWEIPQPQLILELERDFYGEQLPGCS